MAKEVNIKPLDFAAKVKIALLKDGAKTQAEFAKELGVTRQYLNQIIHGKAESPDLKREICARLRLRYED